VPPAPPGCRTREPARSAAPGWAAEPSCGCDRGEPELDGAGAVEGWVPDPVDVPDEGDGRPGAADVPGTAGTGSEGAETEGAGADGTETVGVGTDGTDTVGVGVEGTETGGTDTLGVGVEGIEMLGVGTEGTDTSGVWTSGTATTTSETDGSGAAESAASTPPHSPTAIAQTVRRTTRTAPRGVACMLVLYPGSRPFHAAGAQRPLSDPR